MSRYTVANLPRITREELAEAIRAKNPGVSVIDVRDNDFVGGHILGCQNVPVNTHDYRIPELVRTLKKQDTVVFHCALSQQRGPSSALRYLRERERMAEKGELGIADDGGDLKQRVCVLEGGFVKWQEMCVDLLLFCFCAGSSLSFHVLTRGYSYGEDTQLTEGYAKDLWDDKW